MIRARDFCAVITSASFLVLAAAASRAMAGQAAQRDISGQGQPEPSASKPAAPSSPQGVETEKIQTPSAPTPPATLASEAGSLRPEEIAALLKNIHFTEYRINDLLTDVKPDRWKLPQATLDSLTATLTTLHTELDALEQWRAQFGERTTSVYLGFQTYAAIDAVLPRLNGVAASVKEHENASYAAQFGQAGNQLFDTQQKIGAYLGSLLHSQDAQMLALDNNLATCQQTLTTEMRGKTARPIPLKNAKPIRPERRRSAPATRPKTKKKPEAEKG